jgi:hypothetical protein
MTKDEIVSCKKDGYIIKGQLFSKEEIQLLYEVASDNNVTLRGDYLES